MKALEKVFEYQGKQVRTIFRDGEALFCGKDVCDVLDYVNAPQAIGKLDDDEKGIYSTDTLGGKQDLLFVTEPGLYTLILGSRKKEAKQFKRWVTHEVLPTIRRTGGYNAMETDAASIRELLNQVYAQLDLVSTRLVEMEKAAVRKPHPKKIAKAGVEELVLRMKQEGHSLEVIAKVLVGDGGGGQPGNSRSVLPASKAA